MWNGLRTAARFLAASTPPSPTLPVREGLSPPPARPRDGSEEGPSERISFQHRTENFMQTKTVRLNGSLLTRVLVDGQWIIVLCVKVPA
jgi:hypothetical protein